MAGDDMAAELVAEAKRALEVEAPPLRPHAWRGAAHGFGRDVDGEPVRALVDHGQADARAGDRGSEVDPPEVVAAGDPKAEVAPRLDRDDAPDVGDDSGEHQASRTRS
jgi:hypothetical protein